ncbi:MAG: hypothetical protein AAF357_11215, partial [Verrucomicrobiota bacterium]
FGAFDPGESAAENNHFWFCHEIRETESKFKRDNPKAEKSRKRQDQDRSLERTLSNPASSP